MSRHGHKEMERCKRIAAKTSVEAFKAKAHSLHRLCSAAALCAELAVELDKRADNASEADHQSGEYGNLRHDSEIMRLAKRVFEREQQQNAELTHSGKKNS